MQTFLYVGGFILPDLNPAAQRVMNVAKALREGGNKVCFLNYTKSATKKVWVKYNDFDCYECPERGMKIQLTNIDDVKKIIEEINVTAVIAYNYPAIALHKLLLYCHSRGTKVIADVTEWYQPKGNILFRLAKTFDTEYRMTKLHFKTDGIIAISRYLYEYYSSKVKTIQVPPLVDCSEEKWISGNKNPQDVPIFVYAGSAAAVKERVNLIISAIESVKENVCLHVFGITQQQYEDMYNEKYTGQRVKFMGRVPNIEAIRAVRGADWTIVIRENSKLVKAGFPTKVVESISSGTPIIANNFSNITDYLNDNNSIITEIENLPQAISQACSKTKSIDTKIFDYHTYVSSLQQFVQ